MPIEKLRPSSFFTEDKLRELKQVVPEAFADGKVNWQTLREALGEHIEEEGRDAEHFGLFWPGKREARRHASTPSTGTLVPVKGEGINEETTRNIFIEGENLEVLKILRKSYAGRIKMIYIDPPYNTGNDFLYDDNFTEPLEEYLRRTGQTDDEGRALTTNKKSDGRFHSKWLSMMYPRLKLARELLRDDGVIFVSIDDNEVHNLREIMNEIYGEENFLGCAVRVSKKANNQGDYWAPNFDYLLTYSKSKYELQPFLGGINYESYNLIETDGPRKGEKYQLLRLYMTSLDPMRGCTNQRYYIECPDGSFVIPPGKNYPKEINDGSKIPPESGKDKIWRWTKETYEKNKDKIVIKQVRSSNLVDQDGKPAKWNVFTKTFLQDVIDNSSATPNSLIENHINQNSSHELNILDLDFDFAKPSSLITYLMEISRVTTNDIVMDFFAGSSSTAQGVFNGNIKNNVNSKFIMIQYPEVINESKDAYKAGYKTISSISKERIRRVIKNVNNEKNINDKANSSILPGMIENKIDYDMGFKIFTLNGSTFKPWQNYHGEDIFVLENLFSGLLTPLVDGWKEDDLFIEVVLLEGFPLDSVVEPCPKYKKNKVKEVSSSFCEHKLFICLDKKIDQATIKDLSLGNGDVFICLDSAVNDETKARLSDKGLIKTI